MTDGHMMLLMFLRHLFSDKGMQLVGVLLGSSPCFGAIQYDRLDVGVEDSDLAVEGEGSKTPNGTEGVECMSDLVDPALDVFVCPSIFIDDTAQVGKLLHVIQVFVVECDGVLFLVVYSHHLRLLRPRPR